MTSQVIELITMWLKDERGSYECDRQKCRADDDVDPHGYILSKSDGGSSCLSSSKSKFSFMDEIAVW